VTLVAFAAVAFFAPPARAADGDAPAPPPAATPATAPAATAPAATAPAAPSPEVLAAATKLVIQLDDDDFKVRDRAAASLIEIGPPLLPFLGKAASEPGRRPEVATRLAGIVKRIEELRDFGPSFVTLDLKDAPPGDAFAELARQAGFSFAPGSEAAWTAGVAKDRRITLSAKREPFWIVLTKLCEQVGAVPTPVNAEGRGKTDVKDRKIALAPLTPGLPKPPVAASDLAALVGLSLNTQRSVQFGVPNAPRFGSMPGVQFMVQMLCEPKLRVDAWSIESFDGETDAGDPVNSSTPGVSGMSRINAVDGPTTIYLNLPKDKAPAALKRLTLNAQLISVRKTEDVVIKNPTDAHETESLAGGFRTVFQPMTKIGDSQYELKFRSTRQAKTPAEWEQFRAFVWARFLPVAEDPAGNAYEGRIVGASVGGDWMELTVRLTPGGNVKPGEPPARLVWKYPTEVKTLPTKFVLTNVLLP
jgi:hypothetical protein